MSLNCSPSWTRLQLRSCSPPRRARRDRSLEDKFLIGEIYARPTLGSRSTLTDAESDEARAKAENRLTTGRRFESPRDQRAGANLLQEETETLALSAHLGETRDFSADGGQIWASIDEDGRKAIKAAAGPADGAYNTQDAYSAGDTVVYAFVRAMVTVSAAAEKDHQRAHR